jgi:hypothetical protein
MISPADFNLFQYQKDRASAGARTTRIIRPNNDPRQFQGNSPAGKCVGRPINEGSDGRQGSVIPATNDDPRRSGTGSRRRCPPAPPEGARRRLASIRLRRTRRDVMVPSYILLHDQTGFQERSTSTSISVGPSAASACCSRSPRSDNVVALCACSPRPRATETKSTRGLSRSIAT